MAATGLYGMVTLVLLLSLPAALADANFFSHTCNRTANPDACRSVLGHYWWSINATTVVELAGTGFDMASFKARDIMGAMNELSKEGRYAGTHEGDALVQCTHIYDKAMNHDLDQAVRRLHDGKYGQASQFVSRAKKAGDACEKAFAHRGVRSVVSDLNQAMKVYCGVVGDLILLLLKGGSH